VKGRPCGSEVYRYCTDSRRRRRRCCFPRNQNPPRDVCESVCNEVRELGAEAVGVHGDLTKVGVIEELVESAMRAFSGIDIIVNNA